MKKMAFMAVAVWMLSGCMTSNLAAQEPIYAGHSKKSPQKYTQCLGPKWQELHPSTKMVETETGYQLLASNDLFGAVALAKIDADGVGGTNIKLYAVSRGINDPWGKAGRSCL